MKKKVELPKKGRDLALIFYALGSFILLLMIIQFIAYHIFYSKSLILMNFTPLFNLFGVFSLDNDTYKQFQLPYKPLIDGLLLYTTLYGGLEGATSVIKSINQPIGVSQPMPEYKLKRFFNFIIFWFIIALISSLFQMSVSIESGISFYSDAVFAGLIGATMAYGFGRQGSKTGENIHISQKKNDCMDNDNNNSGDA